MENKFGCKKGHEFNEPKKDYEKEYVVDKLIERLIEVKKTKWGTVVALDPKQIKFLIDEAVTIFNS